MYRKIFIIILVFSAFIFAGNVYAAITDQLDDSVKFFVDEGYDASGRSQVNATLRKTSEHAYFYTEDIYFNSLNLNEQTNFLNAQELLAQEFDFTIYPKLRDFYGSEWVPGIDGDNRITFLFTPMPNDAGGYFRTNDEVSINDILDSNEREMIYFNANHITNSRAKSLIAHEFQHLISFYQKDKLKNIVEEVWLNEMRSEYASTIVGYDDNYTNSNIRYRENFFLATPNDPLVEWLNKSEDYGVINFFAQYLSDHYGKNIFSSMIINAQKGIVSINQALQDEGFDENFSNIFSDWTIASIINDCSAGSGRYCYKNANLADLKIDPTTTYNISSPYTSISVGGTMKDWSARWYKFFGTNFSESALRLNFKGANADGDFYVPYIVEKKDGVKNIKYLNLSNNEGMAYIRDFGSEAESVTVIPASHFTNIADKSSSDDIKNFTLTVDAIENSDIPEGSEIIEETILVKQKLNLPDGSLVRARGDYRVYIVQGDYRRHILDGKIFDFYGHLFWDNIHEVDPLILAGYKESFLVRAIGDKKVYEINGDKTKHWLNMSAEAFTLSGRHWDSISIINEQERDFYITGSNVKF